jgi:two-component system, NtrC family, nitrogen regulation sensor histidine kinase NtrY
LALRLTLLVTSIVGIAIGAIFAGVELLLLPLPIVAVSVLFGAILPIFLAVRRYLQPQLEMFRALAGTANSYRDGDYSFSLHWGRHDEIGDLVDSHNVLGKVLREQRLALTQRELLLDTMVQNSPVAMILTSESGPVVFANLAARQLLYHGRPLEGHSLPALLHHSPAALRDILQRGGDGIFTVESEGDGEDEIYFLAKKKFSLNGRRHELMLLRHITVELRRQEVQTWKQVIRVISHELNNSLAPIASLAASSAELVRRNQVSRLPELLKTIEDRTRHLERFIAGYAKFAKLPEPRCEVTTWKAFVTGLHAQVSFSIDGEIPEGSVAFDIAQMEQALINLMKNAHESGSSAEDISLSIKRSQGAFVIEVKDRGTGMTDTVLQHALIPFYSTKRSGTGIGLALTREIIEAHQGRISISNRSSGGLKISLILPA